MTNKPGQKTVRAGQFDAAMEQMNHEMAIKTALTMSKFHELYVRPMERRILFLELSTGIRLMRWIVSLPWRIKAWFLLTFTEPVIDEPDAIAEPEPAIEPEHDGRSRVLTLSN